MRAERLSIGAGVELSAGSAFEPAGDWAFDER
jgi:hypothetical protein